jgi:hypothetical protein
MRRIATGGALIAASITIIASLHALYDPKGFLLVRNCILFPGGVAAFGLFGDNYRSEQQFLKWAIALGIPINSLAGAVFSTLGFVIKNRVVNKEIHEPHTACTPQYEVKRSRTRP